MKLTWFGHSSVKLETGSQVIYIDPYAGPDEWYTPGSLILVSRFHFDHCSVSKVRLASHDATHILGAPEVAGEVYPAGSLSVNEHRKFDGVEVIGMPVENPHTEFRRHTEEIGAIGFAISAEDKTVYFMADSDYLPSMKDLKPDVLLIAVGGTYTAAPEEAAKTVNLIAPKLAIPIHWGDVVGTKDDAELFSELTHVPVKILEQGESVEI